MKKKLLGLSLLLFAAINIAHAQCTPDPAYTTPGIYPDSATGLAPAFTGIAYTGVITNVVPADTLIELIPEFPQSLTIDSVNVDSVVGLPAGFGYACVPNNCSFSGNSIGCMAITGTAATTQTGVYPLAVYISSFIEGTGIPFPFVYTAYHINVVDSASVTVDEMNGFAFDLLQNRPNPFSENTTIRFKSNVPDVYQLSVVDLLGKEVINKTIHAHVGVNNAEINGTGLRNGIYMYTLSNNKTTKTRRMVVNK